MVQRKFPMAVLSATILGVAIIASSPVMAQMDFYKGRSITMLIGSGAGGG